MVEVSNADRVVFPDVGRTKGDVVRYYERIAPRILAHVVDRPLSLRRFPKGLAAPGFFQKNVPPHYPASIGRLAVPRSQAAAKKHPRKGAKPSAGAAGEEPADVTSYPLIHDAEHLAFLANQGAIELHVPTARASDLHRPDRIVIDLDPPPGALERVRKAARLVREACAELGLETAVVATGSKGYHVVAPIDPVAEGDAIAVTMQKLATLLAAAHPDDLTTAFRVAKRGGKVFVDWLRNNPGATVVAPYSIRARPKASVAAPIAWDELETIAPDGFTIADLDRLLERPDSLADLATKTERNAKSASEAATFVARVEARFAESGLVLEPFDRFRS